MKNSSTTNLLTNRVTLTNLNLVTLMKILRNPLKYLLQTTHTRETLIIKKMKVKILKVVVFQMIQKNGSNAQLMTAAKFWREQYARTSLSNCLPMEKAIRRGEITEICTDDLLFTAQFKMISSTFILIIFLLFKFFLKNRL